MQIYNLENKIVKLSDLRMFDEIREIRTQLTEELEKLDRWFDKYLNMFSEKLDTVDKNDPVKKLYVSKYNYYSNLSQVLRTADVYLKKAK